MDERTKLFAISNQMAERELDAVEDNLKIDLGRHRDEILSRDEVYYPQFDLDVRSHAGNMAEQYELFYCLEVSIRALIKDKLSAELGPDWWVHAKMPEHVRAGVSTNIQNELDAAFTQRSDEEIDYTNFGDLGEIVRKNWEHFGDLFNSQKAFNRVMTNLNIIRGPIAHCGRLAEDEVVRLRLAVGDWFRLME
ncbi:hypothetical protein LP7551_03737 [Roseibium album]|nr:hypothetical protein LP7551_03737 [Roseibium album]